MAEPAPVAGGLTGGLFKNLSPKARRYATAVAVAMVLALIVILGRRNRGQPPADSQADPLTDGTGDLGEPIPLGDPPFQPQSTFADNGEAAGILSSAITEGMGQVGSALTDEQQAFQDLTDKLGTPAAAPGPLGNVGKNKGQSAQVEKQKAKIAAQKKRIGQLQKQGKRKPAPKSGGGGGGGSGKPPPKKKKK